MRARKAKTLRLIVYCHLIVAAIAACHCGATAQDALQSRFDEALKEQLSISGEISDAGPAQEYTPAREQQRQPQPKLDYERPAKAVDPGQLSFVRWHASWCGPCRQMERSGVYSQIEKAGWQLRSKDIDKEPDARVKTVPQLWLVNAVGEPVRIWSGPCTLPEVLDPVVCSPTVRITDSAGKVFSGVCLANGLILTCAHHKNAGPFKIELPIGELTSGRYITTGAKLLKQDALADLSLLCWTVPPGVTVEERVLADDASRARSIEGFALAKPKRVLVTAQGPKWTPADGGPAQLSLTVGGISTPQFGMSGGPALDADGKVVGIQCMGNRNEVGIAALQTIRDFVDQHDGSLNLTAAIATLTEVPSDAIGDSVAAAFAVHCLEDQNSGEEATFGSLLSVNFDVPDSALEIAQQLLRRQKLELPAAGIVVDWSGDSRRIELTRNRVALTPGLQLTVAKFGLSKRCRLDAITYAEDLSCVTFELSGMLDLTVHLK
jgi:thiol-disulfide isomerase/thioredoxin